MATVTTFVDAQRAPVSGRCEKCAEPATHTAQFRRKKQRLCCRHYEQLTNKVLEMIEEIRQAVK